MRLFSVPILQRYILKELLTVFSFLLSGLTVLLVFIGVIQEAKNNSLGLTQVLQILPYVVPSLLPFTIPATLLLTICVVYGRMAGDREVIAAKSAGINTLSLLLPAFALGGMLSLCSLLLADKAIPWAVKNIQKTIALAMGDIFLDMLEKKGHVVDEKRGFSVVVMGVNGKTLERPTFKYQQPGGKPITVQAEEATLEFDIEKQQLILRMVNAHVETESGRRVWLEEEIQAFPLQDTAIKPKPRHLSIRTINKQLETVHSQLEQERESRDIEAAIALTLGEFERLLQTDMTKYERDKEIHRKYLTKLRTEIHSRFALASSCFFFVFLGAPFAIFQERRQFLTSFFICFLPILVLYYPIAFLTMNLAKSGSLPPYVLWSANIILFIAAIFMLRKVLKH